MAYVHLHVVEQGTTGRSVLAGGSNDFESQGENFTHLLLVSLVLIKMLELLLSWWLGSREVSLDGRGVVALSLVCQLVGWELPEFEAVLGSEGRGPM